MLDIISNHTPNEVAFLNKSNWTIALVREYIKNTYDVDFCISATHVVMKRLGLSHTRPTYVLAKADKEKQKQFIEDFESLKKSIVLVKTIFQIK